MGVGPIDRAEGRYLFGSDPAGYDRARPGHPSRVYDVLRERCGLGPGSVAIEVGPGTGQATRRLLEFGASHVVAIEPDSRLARFLEQAVDGRVQLRLAPLEEVELVADAFDLAVAASSFHWIDEPVGLAKLYEALRAGGWIALWWTLLGADDRPDPFRDATDPLLRDLPSSPHEGRPGGKRFPLDVSARFEGLRTAGFAEPSHELIRWSFEWDARGIRELFATFSPIARLDEVRRSALLDALEIIAAEQFGGRVEKPIVTSLFTARKPE